MKKAMEEWLEVFVAFLEFIWTCWTLCFLLAAGAAPIFIMIYVLGRILLCK